MLISPRAGYTFLSHVRYSISPVSKVCAAELRRVASSAVLFCKFDKQRLITDRNNRWRGTLDSRAAPFAKKRRYDFANGETRVSFLFQQFAKNKF